MAAADSKSGSNNLARLKQTFNPNRPSSSSNAKIDSFAPSKKKLVQTTSITTKSTSTSIFSNMTKKPSKAADVKPKTREKKVFSLAGQKFDVPEEREPLRIFYESLSEQIPSSEMAEFWLMEHGLLSPEKSKKAHEKKQRKQKQLRSGIPPVKSPPPSTSSRPSQSKPESSKRLPPGHDDEDDFVLSHRRRKA